MFSDRNNRKKSKLKDKKCPVCGKHFEAKAKRIYCSKQCSGKVTRNRLGTKKGYRKHKSSTEARLNKLKELFGFTECMVRGCCYNRTFQVHRLIEGRNGGKYEIGNMFAICPNHHAECHHGLIRFVKISDSELLAEDMAR
jgi:hypothetical protein